MIPPMFSIEMVARFISTVVANLVIVVVRMQKIALIISEKRFLNNIMMFIFLSLNLQYVTYFTPFFIIYNERNVSQKGVPFRLIL